MTTIITKHGTGTPASLAVGELAIDKSEPAIYTNTGTKVEKIAGAASAGGGGGGHGFDGYLTDFVHPAKRITLAGTAGPDKWGIHQSAGSGVNTEEYAANYLMLRCKAAVGTYTWNPGQYLDLTTSYGYFYFFPESKGYNTSQKFYTRISKSLVTNYTMYFKVTLLNCNDTNGANPQFHNSVQVPNYSGNTATSWTMFIQERDAANHRDYWVPREGDAPPIGRCKTIRLTNKHSSGWSLRENDKIMFSNLIIAD